MMGFLLYNINVFLASMVLAPSTVWEFKNIYVFQILREIECFDRIIAMKNCKNPTLRFITLKTVKISSFLRTQQDWFHVKSEGSQKNPQISTLCTFY